MLPVRLARASALRTTTLRRLPTGALVQLRSFWPESLGNAKEYEKRYPNEQPMTDKEDPNMNGAYPNPPAVKAQFRDPHGDWFDKQERRNFGEPLHEDQDIMFRLSPHEYTWTTMGPGLLMWAGFISVVLSVCGTVYAFYPDRPSYPREFEGGLQRELGGPGAVRARRPGDPDP